MDTAKRVLFDPSRHFERYNGGWTKSVIGLNKEVTNGFSILGDFMPKDKKEWYHVNRLYLDCGIGGSRKNQTKYYSLFMVLADGSYDVIAESKGNDWATDLWDAIDNNLNPKESEWVNHLLLLQPLLDTL